jgi:hypothetical protein
LLPFHSLTFYSSENVILELQKQCNNPSIKCNRLVITIKVLPSWETALSSLYRLNHLMITQTPWDRYIFLSSLTDEETETKVKLYIQVHLSIMCWTSDLNLASEFMYFVLFCALETRPCYVARVAWNLELASFYLSFLSTGIIGWHHHTQFRVYVFKQYTIPPRNMGTSWVHLVS